MSRQRSPRTERASQRRQRRETLHTGRSVSWKPPEAKCAERIKGSHETRSTLVRRHEQPTERGRPRPKGQGTTRRQHETEVDTEAGMLSGVSRKRSIRSNPCWFTEFCKSQCLSHFAAPFIVVRAETSVAESCKEAITVWRLPPTGRRDNTLHWLKNGTVKRDNPPNPGRTPRVD